MGWFTRSPPQPVVPTPEPAVPPSPTLVNHEERLQLIEARLRAIDVEIEDFVSKVSAAAKRAYKREADAERREEKEPSTLDRAGRKKLILAQLRQQRGG